MNAECLNQPKKWVVSKPKSWSACYHSCDTDRIAGVAEALKKGPIATWINAYCLRGYSSGVLSTADYDSDDIHGRCTPDGALNHIVVIVGIKNVEGTLSWVI